MVITRRGLLAAGGALALAGCGADAEGPPADSALLGGVLVFQSALVRAYARVPGRVGSELGARAGALEQRLRAAGGALALAGCGADAEGPPADSALLGGVLVFQSALVRAYARVPGRLGNELGSRAGALEQRLRAAGAATRERVDPAGGAPLEAALQLERRAMGATLAAIGDLRSAAHRDLAAEAMTSSAQHAAVLLDRLGRDPLQTPFPDGRTA